MGRDKRVTFDVDEKTHKALRMLALELDITLSDLMRQVGARILSGEISIETARQEVKGDG